MTVYRYKSLTSTNNEASRLAPSLANGDTVVTHTQTAGRGQRGNSWEAAPGMNLTFSVFLRPENIPVPRSFLISMATAVAIVESLAKYLPDEEVSIKWPNDIYVADKKLAGILIENSFMGQNVESSIIGIGLNVNQSEFLSDAPNPVSMSMITGQHYDLDELLDDIVQNIVSLTADLSDSVFADNIIRRYHSRLWRRTGVHRWRLPDGEEFDGSILRVAPTGHLELTLPDGSSRSFAFKEVFPVM